MSYTYSLLRFVPDPARGEFVNFGILAGDDDAADWELRLLQNYKRAKAIDETGALKVALAFVDDLEAHLAALENVPETAATAPMSLDLVSQFSVEMQNVVQLTPPMPIVATSAREVLDILSDQLLVDPLARTYPFEKKNRAYATTRRAYREHDIPETSFAERAPLTAGPDGAYDGSFDFAVFNGQAVQLAHCWSFQIPNQAELADQVKSWAWVVKEIRNGGGTIRVGEREVHIPGGIDLEIAAISVPPLEGQEDTHAYDEARAAFNETNVRELRTRRRRRARPASCRAPSDSRLNPVRAQRCAPVVRQWEPTTSGSERISADTKRGAPLLESQ